jgi:sugar lactone lactonase YvrE/uncharacterized protein (DUF2141 family)
MAIETRAYIRRLAHTGIGLLMGVLLVCGTAWGEAAPAMTTGSVVVVPSNPNWGQIGIIAFYDGNVLALDVGNGSLYQLSPGATSWSTLVDGTALTPQMFGTGFSTVGMTLDAKGNAYFGIRYGVKVAAGAYFFRVPYDSTQHTWHPVATDVWGGNIHDPSDSNKVYEKGVDDMVFINSPAMDGSGTLYWGSESSPYSIYSVPVDAAGNSDLPSTGVNAVPIIQGLFANQNKLAVDVNQNIYFIENRAVKNTQRVNGIFFIPAGTGTTSPAIIGTGVGDAEAPLTRIDSSSNTVVYGGVTLDAAGDLYITSESNSTYDETFNGIWMIPNECAGAKGVNNGKCLNFAHISLVNPVGSNNAIAIDPRGYLWIPSYQDWTPSGSGPYPGVYAIVVWAPGSLNLGVSGDSPTILSITPNFGTAGKVTITGMNFGPTQGTSTVVFNGQASTTTVDSWSTSSITVDVPADGTTGNVFVTVGGTLQSDGVTILGGLQSNGVNFTYGTSGSGNPGPSGAFFVNFNDPNPVTIGAVQFPQTGSGTALAAATANPNPPTSGTPAIPCTAGQSYASTTTCQIWVAQNPGTPGAISGQVTISGVDSITSAPASSSVYLTGTELGAELAMLDSPQQTAVAGAAAGLVSPAQVAADSLGNTYVADPGLKQVLMFKAGSSGAAGSQIGSGWSSPTGVAVDGPGDVYVADSGLGKVTEFPFVNGALSSTGQTVASGLGKNLNLAVNGVGEAFVADPQNSQVVEIPNPAAVNLIPNALIAGVNASSTVTVSSVDQAFSAPSAVAVDDSGNLFVADGQTLLEISPLSLETIVTNQLTPPVTGLAVETSGSVLVAQKGGILRIPSIGGTLTFNSAGPVATKVTFPMTAPNGVALDPMGNLYVSDMTSGANLYELAVMGSIDFGQALTPEQPADFTARLYSVGNLPLSLTGTPAFTVNDALGGVYDYLPGGTCDTTGATSVTTGLSCTLDLQFTGPVTGVYSGDTMTVATTAANAGSVTSYLGGTVLRNLVPTSTAITVTPPASTFPGITTVTVAVTPEPTVAIPANGNAPTGKVDLALACMTAGCTQATINLSAQASGDATGTTASFQLTGIPGGTYCVTASYEGSIVNLFQPSASPDCAVGAPNFTVNAASPAITLSEPLGITANAANGIYYVQAKQTGITITANITSTLTLGTPTGSVTFTNGGAQVGAPVSLDANGNAVLSTGGLAVGSYSIIANYSGDQNFAAAASSVIVFQVIQPSVLITANPASVSTKAGTPGSSTLTLYSVAGFSAANGANITCNMGTLYYAECTFSVPQPVICAPTATSTCTGITTTVVTISSNIPVNLPPGGTASVQTHGSGTSPLIPAGIFGLGLFGLALRRKTIFNRKLLNSAGAVLMLIGVVMGVGGCTNSSYTKTPPPLKFTTTPGTYQVGIVVTDPGNGNLESLPFTLPVTIQ